VWLIAGVLAAIGGFIVLRVHHAVRAGDERMLQRIALLAARTPGPLPALPGVQLAVIAPDGRVLSGRLPVASALAPSRLAGADRALRQGSTTIAIVHARRGGRAVVVAASSRLPTVVQRRLVTIEAEGLIPIGFVALALALIGFERAARRHRRRLERLAHVAEALDRGDLDARTGEHAGDELGGVGVRLDVLADRLQLLERSRGTVLSQVTHDVRSPLALIRAYAWSLRKGEDSATRSDRLQTIEEEAARVASLVDDLLVLGRRSATETAAEPVALVDVAEVAARVVGRRVAQAIDDGLALELAGSTGGALVAIRAGALERIVGNLVENALRHAASRVTVAVEADANEVVVSCVDDGRGIPDDEVTRLFEPFWSGAAGPGASGLGLPIARELAAGCGGTVDAENVPGGGARLVVRLPRAPVLVGGVA
jgi:signal transduction histidine kinase